MQHTDSRRGLQWPLLGGGLALLLAVLTAAAPVKTGTVYKWTDDKGEIHYGDAVPAQYAEQEQTILNQHGLAVGAIPGRHSAEQIAAEDAAHATEESARDAQKKRQQRDQNLLATYLSVEEIETLRDRRSEIIDGQARVISQYLEQLTTRTTQLTKQMRHFRPYATKATSPVLPEHLAEDVVRTLEDTQSQQRALRAKREELQHTRDQFAEDIARFRELKETGKSFKK